jgi:hypothetical protein
MTKRVVKKTQYGEEIHFKLENDKLMVLYKAVFDDYVLITEFVEKNILTNHEIDVLIEGSEEFGLRLIFKPTLIKKRK